MKKSILSFALSIFVLFSNAQIEGDNIFGQDQVISIDLVFPQSDFWTTLTANYDADENEYIPADLTLTDITGTYQFDSVGVRLKGNSSYNHPGNKKSFKIDFNKFISGQNYDGLKKLNFSNGFKDPSVIREKIFFDVCREAAVPAPRASFGNVTMNGTAWGFYTVIEQIDDQFLDWAIDEDDGNLFKAGDNFGGGGPGGGGGDDAADLVYYGADQSEYEEKYELKTNEDINDWTDLIDLIDFINNSTDANFESELSSRIEMTDFLRSAALDMLFSNLDTYTGSARNYYIYHNLNTNRWEWIKWDGNECFGTYTNGVGNMLTLAIDYHEDERPLLNRIFENDNLYQLYLDEVCDLTENYFNSVYLDARIDEIKTLVQEHVYADNNKMYTDANFDTNVESDISAGGGGPGGGTVYGLKSFVSSRASYIAGQINCSGSTGLEEKLNSSVLIYPNPSLNDLMIESDASINLNRFQVIDTQGRIIMDQGINTSQFQSIDVSNLAAGSHILLIYSDQGIIRKLFQKEN